jgi:hypothetical protein
MKHGDLERMPLQLWLKGRIKLIPTDPAVLGLLMPWESGAKEWNGGKRADFLSPSHRY